MPQSRGSHVQNCNPCMTNLTKITASINEVALSYHTVRGISFLPAIFALTLALGVGAANAWNTVGVRVRLCRWALLLLIVSIVIIIYYNKCVEHLMVCVVLRGLVYSTSHQNKLVAADSPLCD